MRLLVRPVSRVTHPRANSLCYAYPGMINPTQTLSPPFRNILVEGDQKNRVAKGIVAQIHCVQCPEVTNKIDVQGSYRDIFTESISTEISRTLLKIT